MPATLPTEAEIFEALDETWPARRVIDADGWRLRDGGGGGKRVSAATRTAPDADIAAAIVGMEELGQTPLFQVRGNEPDLDAALAAKGFDIVDPVLIYAAPSASLNDGLGEQSRIYRCEGPIAAMREIWAAGGIDASRLAVMDRAAAPKTWLMSRLDDRAAAVGFVSVPGAVAMIHAIETAAAKRRRGAARALLSGAGIFATANGADNLALAVTKANEVANNLYQALGMAVVAEYHYRIKTP